MIAFPDVTPGEPLAVSATLYTTYLRCPEQALGRMRGEYPPESRASFLGGLAHRLFARHLTEGDIPPERIEQVSREEIGRSMNPKMASLGLRPSDLTTLIREAGDLYARFKRLSIEGFSASEVMLEYEPAEGVTLRGKVDAVFEEPGSGPRLVDWKTGGLWGAADQLAFYALLWALDRGELPGRIEAVSVATGERYEEVPTLEQAGDTARTVAGIVSTLRTAFETGESLERIGGPWCRYCPLLEGCAEGAAAAAMLAH